MIRIKNFFTWLRGGSFLTSGPRNTLIAAHAATSFMPREGWEGLKGDGGTVMTEQAGITETPEECSRRLKRERDRRYKAKKKAEKGGFKLPGEASFA
jgi:hypothetical protein